jgi:predicted branched-subunit amino acid permease
MSLLNQTYWVAGSVIGSVIGRYHTFNPKGIDFALTALSLSINGNDYVKPKK